MEHLLQNLINLKEKHNACALKVEFESEYFTQLELNHLREITSQVKMDFIIKLGGFSSFKDMEEAKKINADKIIAPMIESAYAFEKFINTYKKVFEDNFKQPQTYINIETKCGIENILDIFNSPNIKEIEGIILGRGDMAHSLEIQNTEDERILQIALAIKKQATIYSKKLIIGGQITPCSIPFLEKINPDGAETRKILFNGIPTKDGIISAILFEKNLLNQKSSRTSYDIQRTNELEIRLQEDTTLVNQTA